MRSSNLLINVKSFAVCYNRNEDYKYENFDLLILEPEATTREQIKGLKQKNKVILGYVSIMEIKKTHELFSKIQDKLIMQNGEHLLNSEYNNYNVDLNSEVWTDYLIKYIGYLVLDYGFSGIFIDTIGNIENSDIDINKKFEQIHGLVNILKTIRDEFPDIYIVQNNGYRFLINYTLEFIDGICCENIDFAGFKIRRIKRKMLKRLSNIQKNRKVKVLLLTENCKDKKFMKKISNKFEFIWYDAPKYYMGINTPF